jgi:hypothetical protein
LAIENQLNNLDEYFKKLEKLIAVYLEALRIGKGIKFLQKRILECLL